MFLLACSMLLIVMGCSPEDGADGAQGLQGEQGLPGEQGPTGEPGTENVIYSDWIVSDLPSPLINFEDKNVFTVPVPELTQQLIDEGVIMIFGRTMGGIIHPLPYKAGDPYYHTYQFYIENPEEILIKVHLDEEFSINEPLFSEFRYFLINEGESLTGKASGKSYSKMSYEEIAEYFGIKD